MSTHCINDACAPRPTVLWLPGELTSQRRRAVVTGIALAHVVCVVGLLNMGRVQRVAVEIAPIMVRLVAAPAAYQPPAPPAPPRATQRAPLARLAPQPLALTALATESVVSDPSIAAPAVPGAPAATAMGAASPAALPVPLAVAAATPPPPAQRKVISASAVRYLLEPPVEVPRLSQRAGEHGVVWLRVVVGVRGVPLQVDLFRSSGHRRLDEQALWAMRQARFTPHSEDGRPIEVEVIAPIDYPAP